MGFTDFMQSEKGKITTGVLAAVLITTAVMVPVSIFTDRAVRGEDSAWAGGVEGTVQVWGYDDQVSSTAEKINAYMGVTTSMTDNIYGGQQVLSGEPALLSNSAYHSVVEDIEILDGVAKAEQGLGYLSTSWIESYVEKDLQTLSIYDQTTFGSRNDRTSYLDPLGTEAEKQSYATNTGLQATLNMHVKVPVYVADTITISSTGPVVTIAGDADAQAYFDDIAAQGYADDFAMQLGFFNYVVTDTSNDAYADGVVLPGTDVTTQADITADFWTSLEGVYTAIGGEGTLYDAVIAQQADTKQYSIKIDGTGTNTGLIQVEVEKFEEDLINEAGAFAAGELDLYYDLVNGGSGEGWKVAEANGGEAGSDARVDAFLGTQSRFSKESEITEEFWNYDNTIYGTTNDGTKYLDPTTKTAGQVIGYTTGIDLPAFFIDAATTFDYELTSAEAATALGEVVVVNEEHHAISSFVIDGVEYAYGTTVKVKPIGMSDEAARQIYEFGHSWQDVLTQGLIIGEIVS